MAEKKQTIVIKKITVVAGGGHGGSWKVALADFMTALMAFFLVMWLLGQSDETKKAVSDYFSTPSVIEYNFQNFGAEITLEKLFLDLINEPLKAFQQFVEPAEKTPNLLDSGSAKVVTAYLADQVNDFAKNVQVTPDGFDFDIPDTVLFERGTSNPIATFVDVMDKIKAVTMGLQDAEVKITSGLFIQAVQGANPALANKISSERLDLIKNKIQASLEHSSVVVKGYSSVKEKRGEVDPQKLIGFIKISIRQKDMTSSGRKPRKLETVFGDPNVSMSVYENFVKQASQRRLEEKPQKKFGKVDKIENPVNQELKNRAPEELSPSSHGNDN
ncbi:MAG: chemotaxis protein MotB [Bdellovibrionaceae bacterium]|nr:chemotaxis protein MotB [Pseudobdellovibrionaceae bacterium]